MTWTFNLVPVSLPTLAPKVAGAWPAQLIGCPGCFTQTGEHVWLKYTNKYNLPLNKYFVAGCPQRSWGCDPLLQKAPKIDDRDLVIISAHPLGPQGLHGGVN